MGAKALPEARRRFHDHHRTKRSVRRRVVALISEVPPRFQKRRGRRVKYLRLPEIPKLLFNFFPVMKYI